ncbi:hypothetical protein ACFT2B_26885, partial [Micromonospora sp. NPDC057140]
PWGTPGPGRPTVVARLPGLCRSYLAKPVAQRAKALTTPAYAPLVAAAGGATEVDAFCRRLVPDVDPGGTPAPRPPRTGRPAPKVTPTPGAGTAAQG